MQISNPAISQYLSSSVNPRQQPDRLPVKSVTIEGQLVDDKQNQSDANKTQDTSFDKDLEQSQTQLVKPLNDAEISQKIGSENLNGSLLIQKKLSSEPAPFSQNETSSETQNFPYGNRRSFEGLSGGSLVIQKYLNNESSASTQAGNSQRNIDFFI
ncbi:MAG: hypothetical protein OQL19_00635 [Gammaproteobacteria bacterium]|nr:hypothetical protein [Gammaproteobacteria bacterium]